MHSPLSQLTDPRLATAGVRLFVKRDDAVFLGNKRRKLKYNLEAAAGHRTLLTFGGAFSHHILATAAVGAPSGFATVGIIRGEEHLPLNPVLSAATRHGMTLAYLDRTRYRRPPPIDELQARFGDSYVIPAGGANAAALRGCAELPPEIEVPFDVLCCSSGTGTTLAGMATALQPGQRAIGFAALKNGGFLAHEVARLQHEYGHPTTNWTIETDFHFGGYARRTPTLDDFIADFHERHDITLNWIYEAKMMYGIFHLLERGHFRRGQTIVAVLA